MTKHLVDVNVERCNGCTRCMRVCPTEAIRIKDKKVHLLYDRCIYCGNCIIECGNNAFKLTSDSFANLNKHRINIAILPLSVYGVTQNYKDLAKVYKTIYEFGFDEIFDLSIITHLIADKMDEMLKDVGSKPYILTQCPTIIRLIQLKFPTLMNNLLPFDFPFEIGAKIAKQIFSEKHNIKEEDIGVSYITECLSNFIAIKEPLGKETSNIDYVFLYSDLLKSLLNNYQDDLNIDENIDVSKIGMQFAKVGAIENSTHINEYISVDGIKHVNEVLEKVYLNAFPNVSAIEAYSCVGGCIGGNFTLENTFLSKWKINHFSKSISDDKSKVYVNQYKKYIDQYDWYFKEVINASDPFRLSGNVNHSIQKMLKIKEIMKKLPNIDCCACGSPSCRALAEDIVNQHKTIGDCLVLNKINRGEDDEC